MDLIFHQGNRANFNNVKEHEDTIPCTQEIEDTVPHSEMDTSVSSNFHHDNYQVPAQTADTISMNSAQASEYEDAESGAFTIYLHFLCVSSNIRNCWCILFGEHITLSMMRWLFKLIFVAVYNHQASSGLHLFLEEQQPAREKIDASLRDRHDPVSLSSKVALLHHVIWFSGFMVQVCYEI